MNQNANAKMVTKLLFRLLPIQILLAAVSAVNGIVSSVFASNYVGIEAMGAVGLYAPLNMLLTSVSTILVGGSVILCGKFMGRNEMDKVQDVFSLNLTASVLISAVFIAAYVVLGLFDLTGFLTQDGAVRPIFNRYLLGQAIGILPLMLGNSFAAFLSLENKGRQTLFASFAYIVVNILLKSGTFAVIHLVAKIMVNPLVIFDISFFSSHDLIFLRNSSIAVFTFVIQRLFWVVATRALL